MAEYVHGNVVRKETAPVAKPTGQARQVSNQVRTNRTKAMHMSKGYVSFLAIAAFIALFACVQYLQLQSEITNRSKHIVSLQQELANAKEENTTRYNAVMNSMNLEEVREIAMSRLGMVYATDSQIVHYKSPVGGGMTQYVKIPESGVIASSDSVK